MKVNNITVEDLAGYLRLDTDTMSDAEHAELQTLLVAAKAFVRSHTGLTAAKINSHPEFVIVVYILVQDMYDNRTLYVDKNHLNKVVDTILGMHSVNLL